MFVVHDGTIVHWDADSERKSMVLDVSEFASLEQASEGYSPWTISTLFATDDFVITGDLYGRLIAKNLSSGSIVHDKTISVGDHHKHY